MLDSTENSTRLFAVAALFQSPAVRLSVRAGYGVLGCVVPVLSKATVMAPAVR